MTDKFIEKQVYVNNQKISYLEGGVASTSDPILFVHGWGVGTEPYKQIFNVLCDRYHVIAPDLPGFNKSNSDKSDWNYNEYAKILSDFVDTLNIKKIHYIGHSLGGGIGVTLAVSRPAFIKSLILVGSTGIPVDPLPKVLVQRAVEMTAQTTQMKFPQIIQIFQGFSYNFFASTQTTIKALLLSLTKDLKSLLPKIEAPCLLLWASNDMTTPIRAGKQFSQLISNSKLIVIDGVYHEWLLFFVDRFTNIVIGFIDEIEAKK